jgi:hypothetical protein
MERLRGVFILKWMMRRKVEILGGKWEIDGFASSDYLKLYRCVHFYRLGIYAFIAYVSEKDSFFFFFF